MDTIKELDYASEAADEWLEIVPELPRVVVLGGIRLNRVARLHDEMLARALQPYAGHYIRNVEDFRLLALLRRKGGMTITAASRSLGVSKAATSARVERLASNKLIDRSVSEFDRRSTRIDLADTSSALVQEILVAVVDAHQTLMDPLTTRETEILAELLAKVITKQATQ